MNVQRVFASHPFQYPFHEADPEPQHCLIVLYTTYVTIQYTPETKTKLFNCVGPLRGRGGEPEAGWERYAPRQGREREGPDHHHEGQQNIKILFVSVNPFEEFGFLSINYTDMFLKH